MCEMVICELMSRIFSTFLQLEVYVQRFILGGGGYYGIKSVQNINDF